MDAEFKQLSAFGNGLKLQQIFNYMLEIPALLELLRNICWCVTWCLVSLVFFTLGNVIALGEKL